MFHRVVITGIGMVSAAGVGQGQVLDALRQGHHGISAKPDWSSLVGTGLAAEIKGFQAQVSPRRKVRGMGRVAQFALRATQEALDDAGLSPEQVSSPLVGMAYGSAHASDPATQRGETDRDITHLSMSGYLKFMGYTCAANLALYYGIQGQLIPTLAGCVSSSLALGTGYYTIRQGLQHTMICGGAEELQLVDAAAYQSMKPASTQYSDQPDACPRPFDVDRDGPVIGEGAATLVLEDLEHARRRGARIYAEIIGYWTCSDGLGVFIPTVDGLARAIRGSLEDAGISGGDLNYVNAHAVGSVHGDKVESEAIARELGCEVAVSSTKSLFGHTVGACGAMDVAVSLWMMQHGFLVPTRNLVQPDPSCAPLNYLTGSVREAPLQTVMSTNFSFGGISTAVILRKFDKP